MTESTFWINNDGYILVDENGSPYFGTTCPCGAACWQRYEVSCIDNEGSDVYGNSGTGKTSEAHWGIPIMTEWKCGGNEPSDMGVLNRWIQDAPGFAHIWTSVNLGSGANSSPCKDVCSVSHTVSQPDLPCSCAPLWSRTSSVIRLPNYSYYVCKWKFIGWQGNVVVSSEVLPIWEYDNFSARGNYDSITGSRYTATKSFRFLTNYVTATLAGPQSYCGSDSAQWSSNKSDIDYGTYYYYSVSGVSGANGYYTQLPNESIWGHRSGSNAWIDAEGNLFVVSSMYKDPEVGTSTLSCCISQITTGSVFRLSSTYLRCCSLPFTTSFTDEQFGHLSVAVNNPETHIHPFIVREARGAQVPRQDIDIEVQPFVTGRYEGSPLWYYRTFATTDWDYPQVNLNNWNYALSLTGTVVSNISGVITAPGVFCPEYWFLYITQAWKACVPDSDPRGLPFLDPGMPCMPGDYCMPPAYMENTSPDGRYSPPPYWSSYETSKTAWKHEVDESLDQNGSPLEIPGLRGYVASTDEHAYQVSRLSIKNYPTWYGSDVKCATSLYGGLWEIPQMDMSDSAWFRRRGCFGQDNKSSWPDIYDSRPYTSCSCAFFGIPEVTPQDVLMNGKQPDWYIRPIMFDQVTSEEYIPVGDPSNGGYYDTCIVFPTSYIARYGSGCPENKWSAIMYWTSATWGQCCVTSGGTTQWVDTPRTESIYVSTGYVGSYHSSWDLPDGGFTWQGNIPDSDAYCSDHIAENISVYNRLNSEGSNRPDSNTVNYWSQSEPGLLIYEYTTSTCNPRTCPYDISSVAKYIIRIGDPEIVIDNNNCPGQCAPLHDGDVVSVTAYCSLSWSKTIFGAAEQTIPNGYGSSTIMVPLPDGGQTDEITNGGTVDLDFEWNTRTTLEYSAEYSGEGNIVWHSSMGYNFNVELSNVYITQTWVTDFEENKHYSFTLSENVSSVIDYYPDGTVEYEYSWGGRIYKADYTSYCYTGRNTTSAVSSLTDTDATHVGVRVKQDDNGVCELNAFIFGFGDLTVWNTYIENGSRPSLPQDEYHFNWSQAWQPNDSDFYVYTSFNENHSWYHDSRGSNTGSLFWNYYSSSGVVSSASSAFYINYAFGVPSFPDMDCEYTWWSRPEVLYPCDFKGIDVLDYAPSMLLSVYNYGDSDYAIYSKYNSGDCGGSWSSIIYSQTYGTTETNFMSYMWNWHAEHGDSAGVNPA